MSTDIVPLPRLREDLLKGNIYYDNANDHFDCTLKFYEESGECDDCIYSFRFGCSFISAIFQYKNYIPILKNQHPEVFL